MQTVNEMVKDSPSYWFSVLQTAIELSDFDLAAEAQGELKRLGVEVKYRQDRKKQRGEVATK